MHYAVYDFLVMTKAKVSDLKQTPYGYATHARVDPTRNGVEKAIREGRFSKMVMDRDYAEVQAEIKNRTHDPIEMDRLMHEYHNERVAELVRTKDAWLNVPEKWPITVNQYGNVIEGNHRFRAIRFLGIDEIDVVIVKENSPRPEFSLPEIW